MEEECGNSACPGDFESGVAEISPQTVTRLSSSEAGRIGWIHSRKVSVIKRMRSANPETDSRCSAGASRDPRPAT